MIGQLSTGNEGRIIETDRDGNVVFEAKLLSDHPQKLFYRAEIIDISKILSPEK